ncbi:MAG: lamin tail domain-containing protein [Bacteroidales bacterium]|nr:lamin tail domain-containing protein [Bacteroidales bacterium]
MKTKLLYTLLSIGLLLPLSCVEDELFEDNTGPVSEIELVINEVASNMGDPIPDWIEIYNPSASAIDMSGFGVYDKPSAIYTFPNGTTIPAHGYLVITCDKDLATADPDIYANFGISSGGESVFLVDAAEVLVDEVAVPGLDVGLSYARIPDGGETFSIANPTKGAANSNTNEPPVIEADTLVTGMLNDNERYRYDVVVKDASGVSSVKLWLETEDEVYYLDMAPMGGGEYRLLLPLLSTGNIAYYIEAEDETGLKTKFRPEGEEAFELSVIDGLAIFQSIVLSNSNPSDAEDIIITVDAYDKSGLEEVRIYYTVNSENSDDKEKIDLTYVNGVWTDTIPGQADGSVIRYYLRATDNASLKSYYPVEELDGEGNVIGDFDHDDATTWPQISVAPLVILNQLVINEINASGDPYDYIELYNATSAAIDISGYKVHDSGGLAEAYIIPASTTIAAGGFYLIETGSGAPQGTFGISGSGENITLTDASDVVIDQLNKENWPGTPLVYRKKDGAELWITGATATPGLTNN